MKFNFAPLFCFLVMLATVSFAQQQPSDPKPAEPKPPQWGINFSGWVNSDLIFDSRQTVNAREGQWFFYPDNIKPDADGKDINAKGSYSLLSIQTRVTGKITGPDMLGAKTMALIEGEFYGNINVNINTFRLRHAYMKFTWTGAELLMGQYWHPMYNTDCAPEVASINGGAPFLVFTRNPQIRVTKFAGNFKFILTALAQIDAPSNGPDGPSPKYLRNTMLPEGDFQVQYGIKNETKHTEFLVGASADYLVLTPRLSTEIVVKPAYDLVVNNVVEHHDAVTKSYVTDATSPAWAFNLFAKYRFPRVTLKAGGVYGQNCYAFNLIGGYAVKSVTDPAKGFVDYSAITTASVWTDLKTNGTSWQTGLFAGFSRNLGAGTDVTGPYYSRGDNIDYLYRVAPRLSYTVKKLKFAGEVDYTVAAYGTRTKTGTVTDSREVANLRLLLSAYYYF